MLHRFTDEAAKERKKLDSEVVETEEMKVKRLEKAVRQETIKEQVQVRLARRSVGPADRWVESNFLSGDGRRNQDAAGRHNQDAACWQAQPRCCRVFSPRLEAYYSYSYSYSLVLWAKIVAAWLALASVVLLGLPNVIVNVRLFVFCPRLPQEMNKEFYCETCNKQYKTVGEMSNHYSSYDHHHVKARQK